MTGGRDADVGPAPIGLQVGSTVLVDLWHTGGPLADATQGGDPGGPWKLEPPAGGVSFRWLQIGAGPPSPAGWHITATIDIDIVLSGRLALELDGDQRVELSAGDVVVQRGTNHRWSALDDQPAQMATVMIAAPLSA